jgi:hypothetical protein
LQRVGAQTQALLTDPRTDGDTGHAEDDKQQSGETESQGAFRARLFIRWTGRRHCGILAAE